MKEIITSVYNDHPEIHATDCDVRAARRADGTLVLVTNSGDMEIVENYGPNGDSPLAGASLSAVRELYDLLVEEGDTENTDWLRDTILLRKAR